MLNWLADKFQSGMNFLGQIGETSAFKATSFLGKLLFGIPLGAVRLLAFDLPLHVGVSVAKWSHTRFYTALGFGKNEVAVVDAHYASLSEWANSTTSSFVKGFMFGSWLQIADKVKTATEDWQEENYGNAKRGGDDAANFAAKAGGQTAEKTIAGDFFKEDRLNMIANPLHKPTNTITNGMTANPLLHLSPASQGRSSGSSPHQ